jgi:hypothetical protein
VNDPKVILTRPMIESVVRECVDQLRAMGFQVRPIAEGWEPTSPAWRAIEFEPGFFRGRMSRLRELAVREVAFAMAVTN